MPTSPSEAFTYGYNREDEQTETYGPVRGQVRLANETVEQPAPRKLPRWDPELFKDDEGGHRRG